MNIGLMVDSVLADVSSFLIIEGVKFFKRKPSNLKGTTIREIFECSEEEEKEFWKKNFIKCFLSSKSFKGTANFTKTIYDSGDKAYLIINSKHIDLDSKFGKLAQFVLEEWLKRNNIRYDEIIYTDDVKSEIEKHNIKIVIDVDGSSLTEKKVNSKVLYVNRGSDDYSASILSELNSSSYSKVTKVKEQIMKDEAEDRAMNEITVLSGKPSIDRPWMKYYSYDCRNLELPDKSVYKYLSDSAKDYSKMIALEYFGKKFTYKEMFDQIDLYAKAFIAKGVKKGDYVTVCLPNVPEAVYMFYALNKIGAVANMVHPSKSANEIKCAVNCTKSKLLVMLDKSYGEVNKVVNDLTAEDIVVVTAGDSMPPLMKFAYKAKFGVKIDENNRKYISRDKFLDSAKSVKNLPEVEVLGNDVAVVMYTGGTSGTPKGVQLTNNNYNRMVFQQKATAKNFGPGDVMLTIMPVFHGFGLCSSIHMPLSYGITTVLIPQFNAGDFYKLMKKYKPNHIFGVPKLWKALMNDPKIKNMDLSSMRYIVSGGENMKDGLEEEINNFFEERNSFFKVKKGYGCTEAVAGTTLSDDNCNAIGSVGIPLVCNRFKVVKPGTEEELGYNQEGEFCISGPTVMLGYLNNPEETSKVLREHSDGKIWLHTGDMGYITEDGMLFYTDRLTRMYINSGNNVYPPRIEKIIEKHDKVKSCAVVPMNHPYKNVQVPKAYIIMEDGYELSEKIMDEISNLCKNNLDMYHQPFRFEQIDEFPITDLGSDIGKIDYKKLEELANENDKALVKRR